MANCKDVKTSFKNVPEDAFQYYVSGFVDGEGCFSVSFRYLKRLRVGVETKLSFSVSQKMNSQNYALLSSIRRLFAGGAIRKDNTGCYKYETRSISHIKNQVIPFFKRYPLHSIKAQDFGYFCDICSLVAGKQHLCKAGLKQIILLANKMNPSGRRRYKLQDFFDLL